MCFSGHDQQGWGLSYKGSLWHGGMSSHYCQPFYEAQTVIGVHLNLYEGTLTFYINGQCQGIAYQDLNTLNEELYPIISATATGTELEVGTRKCRYLSLQEKCYQTVARNLKRKADVEGLPLPPCFKRHLQCLKSCWYNESWQSYHKLLPHRVHTAILVQLLYLCILNI